jgi:hypothetical protein
MSMYCYGVGKPWEDAVLQTYMHNNRLFEYPETIENNKSLNSILSQIEKKINEGKGVERPNTEWEFVKYMHYEIAVFRLSTTIGKAINLPTWFSEGSNKTNVVKFDNFEDNLCFWRCLAAYKNPHVVQTDRQIQGMGGRYPANIYRSVMVQVVSICINQQWISKEQPQDF